MNWPHYDFSHQGPNFPVWHRVLLLWFERELQKIAEDDSFTLPYWDWLNQDRNCTICTNDLMGKSDLGGTVGVMDSLSPFSQWLYCLQSTRRKINLSSLQLFIGRGTSCTIHETPWDIFLIQNNMNSLLISHITMSILTIKFH